MWKGWEKGWNRGALIFYYPGLHTELTADAGIYIRITISDTFSVPIYSGSSPF
jgi:hypothetical protein